MGGGVPPTELAVLTRQLEELLGAGVQLVEALGTLADQSTRPVVKRMLSQVREAVREGSSLADALAAHPNVFSDLYVGMVRAGETAGSLAAGGTAAGAEDGDATGMAGATHAAPTPARNTMWGA